jgi:tetratricopeptide (TPR) repeat protein
MSLTPESQPHNPPEGNGASARQRWGNPITAGLALVGMAVIGYWPSLRGGFVWDDLVLVTKNLLVTGELNLGSVWWRTDFSLSVVGNWLEWLVFKESALGYRIVNLLLHCLSAGLLWKLLARLKIPGAWLGAALFAVHPVATASVAWISELKNTLSLPFFLLSALAFLGFRDRSEAKRKAAGSAIASGHPSEKTQIAHESESPAGGVSSLEIGATGWLYATSLLAFGLALLAKTSTVMLPMVLLLLGWWQDRKITQRIGIQLAPHFGLALIFGSLTIWRQTYQAIRGVQVQTGTGLERLADAGTAVWFYLGKALAPVNLCAIYPDWEDTLPQALEFLPLLLLGAGFGLSWRYRCTWGRSVLLALGCFTVALFPVLGLFDMYFMIFARVSDHLAYLPLMAVTAFVGAAVMRIRHQPRRMGIAVLFLAGALALTWQRAAVYATDEALWQDTVQKNPRAWNAHNNLACNFAERGDLDQAMKHFARSLELNPANVEAQRNLGRALLLRGRFPEAEPHFRAALKLRPTDAETLTVYAEGLAQARRLSEAIELLQQAISSKPTAANRRQLVPLLLATDDYAAAIRELREILARQPESFEDYNNLAWILATGPDGKWRDGVEAVRLAQRACQLSGGKLAMPFGTLAAAYAEAGDFTNAVQTAQTAIGLATAAGNESFATMNRQLLKLYESQRAFHTPGRRQ